MKKYDSVVVVTVLIVGLLLIGQFLMTHTIYNYSSEAERTADGVCYHLSSDADREYIVSLFSDGGHYPDGDVVIYHDESYASYSDSSEVKHIVSSLCLDLPMRGVDCRVSDAVGIADMMRESVDSGNADERLVMVSGALPDTVFSGTDGLIFDWLSVGGVLYWMGAPLGMYVAHPDALEENSDFSTQFFGIEDAVLLPGKTPGHGAYNKVYGDVHDAGYASSLGLVSNECTYGIHIAEMPDSLAIADSTDDGYASIGLTKYHDGDGMIAVFGGFITYDSVWAMSKVIASGLEYDSVLLDSHTGRVDRGGIDGSFAVDESVSGLRLYICIGVPLEVYGKGYSF